MDEPNGSTGDLINPNDMTFAFLVLPPIIAVINQRTWSRETRGVVALVVCLLYSVVVAALRSDLNWSDWRNVVLQVLVGTFGAYKLFWEPTNLVHKIEDATDFVHPAPQPPATATGDTPDARPADPPPSSDKP